QLPGAGFAEGEGEDVGRLVVFQVALVELMDRRVVDEGEAYLVVGDALALQHGAGHLAQAAAVDRHDLLRAGDADLAHETFLPGRMGGPGRKLETQNPNGRPLTEYRAFPGVMPFRPRPSDFGFRI